MDQNALIAALMGGQANAMPSAIQPMPQPQQFSPQSLGYGQQMPGMGQMQQGMFSPQPYGSQAQMNAAPTNMMLQGQ